MRTHVKVLGWLYLILGVLGLLCALAAFGVLTGVGLLSGDLQAFGIMSVIGGLAGFYFALISLPALICGLGLLRGWGGWVLVLAVVLGVLNLPNVPFGTALALYTFWVAYKLWGAAEVVHG